MTSARIEPRPFVKAHSDLVLTFPLSTSRHAGRAHELLRETMRLFFILLAYRCGNDRGRWFDSKQIHFFFIAFLCGKITPSSVSAAA